MSTLNVILLGAGGQLGTTIIADWAQLTNQTNENLNLHCFSHSELNICEPDQLTEKLSKYAPHTIVNTAAYTQVDKAESEKNQALSVNRDGAGIVARWAEDNNCRLIHISTDFVFDGKSSRPYQPEDIKSPVNYYGYSKSEGERLVHQLHPKGSLIVRTGWLYSRYEPNFVTTMVRLMMKQDRLRIVADQIGTPTSTHSLARFILSTLNGDISSGVFHWSDAGIASWYDFAVAIQEEAIAVGLLQSEIPIEPIKASEYPTPATRPMFSVLDKSTSYEQYDIAAVHWRTELRRVIIELNDNKSESVP